MYRSRALGLLIFAYHLIIRTSKFIETDVFYQQKVKYLLNNLIKIITPVLNKFNSFVHEEDRDTIDDQLETRMLCIEHLQDIFEQNPINIYTTELILKNIKEGKSIYTQEEVDKLIEEAEFNEGMNTWGYNISL